MDYVVQFGNDVVPIEVKAGTTGTLKSLHVFMAERGFKKALRINGDKSSVTHVNSRIAGMESTSGYELISLPFYLTEEVARLMR